MLGRPPSLAVWFAVGCGVAGVLLIQPPQVADGRLAALLVLASSLSTALAMIALHRLGGTDARAVIVHFSAVAMAFCVASLLLFDREFATVDLGDPSTLALLLGMGVAALTFQLFLTKAYATGEASRVSVVNLTQVVFALAFDVLLFGYSFDRFTLLGMALVVTACGVALTKVR
jgi:drug/metabolite transporter (DMT)-like permease